MSEQDQRDYPKAYRYRRIVAAKRYIDTHFDESIDLDLISDEAHFSKYHFLRLFKDTYGQTPHQYCTGLRLKKARELLREENMSVSEVCFEVGFESVGSFSSLFKRRVGESPSTYRAKRNNRAINPKTVVPGCFVQQFY
ncbi:helix-turn-helix domain-containing protein [Fodinibius halophilus]|uniref:Helix-turn-helix transcriptional regulator n=1 Tax=Fodinibius halophilus TaxID=1736908 RepID=A0A6M1T352_9BACT|nr:AraC family transcriptional regulator [Fodinibius halophilus]NGP87645.1 helix-turn-helix transcriptional regulator [Fodinibius halophilus]